MNSPTDLRAQQAQTWACEQLHLSAAGFTPASADASFRRYFRLRDGQRSWIVMDAPPERESCRPFVDIARLLRSWGLNTPEILAEDHERGFLLLSDLGEKTYLQILTPENADEYFGYAIQGLLKIQVNARDRAPDMQFLPSYDAALLWREARLFTEWYLPQHLKLTLTAEAATDLERVIGLLVKSALAQPRTFVHRDYMPRNLMLSDPIKKNGGQRPPADVPLHAQRGEGRAAPTPQSKNLLCGGPGAGGASGGVREETSLLVSPGILDFQDAVAGPISYDVICLFKDAFLSWPEARVTGWLQQYWEQARQAALPVPLSVAEFQRQADWMGLHRHLKVLGIFARLSYRDGKAHYVADTPRFVRYVMEVAPKYPELAPLTELFERHILPQISL